MASRITHDHQCAEAGPNSPPSPDRPHLRVLVCGGRSFEQPRAVGRYLAGLHNETPIALIVTGGANGVDRYAENWARHNRVALSVYPANWQFDGRAAGPIRNGHMLRFGRPHLVVAFPGGAGTANMIAQAERAGVEVRFAGSAESVPAQVER